MPSSRLDQLKIFLEPPGAKWHRVNLHVHAIGQEPQMIIDAAIRAGLTLIAITDHNTFKFVKPVQDAAKKMTNGGLVVLPGIEITLEEGAHIIAIFDTYFDETKQNHFLGMLKLPIDGSSKDAVRDKTCSGVLTDITDAKGITIVPHPFSDDIGFLDSARKISTKMSWLESGNVGLIQINDEKVKFISTDDNGRWQNRYILSSTPPSAILETDYCLAPIPPGEARTFDEIDNGAVWLKLGSKAVRGLRQITCEPRTCISKDNPPSSKTYTLLGLTIEGGFFDGLEVGFSPDFNCIIGENHSGKTAIFDFISFALGRDLSVLGIAGREDERDILLRRLNAILQPTGKVHLYLTKDGRSYCVSRAFIPEFDKKAERVINSQSYPEPLRYDPAKDELVPIDIQEISILPEIYTQGHVGVLRRSVVSQLSLIDELAGLNAHRNEKEGLRDNLRINAEALADQYERAEELVGSVGSLEQMKNDLKDSEKYLEATGNTLWQASSLLINNIKSQVESIDETVNEKQKAVLEKNWKITGIDFDETKVAVQDLLGSMSGSIGTYNQAVDTIIQQLVNSVKGLKNEFSPMFDEWAEKYDAHKTSLSKTLRDQGFDSPEQLLDKVDKLQKHIDKIEREDVPRLMEILGEVKGLKEYRYILLGQFKTISEIVTQTRNAKIVELNKTVGPDIAISLEKPDQQEYIDLLKDVCTGIANKDRKIQKRDEQLALVGSLVKPSELIEAILNEGVFKKSDGYLTTLVEACNITQNTQDVLCSIKGESLSLHKLQVFEPEPVPKILVRRQGTDKFANLRTELSPGEQSSTILTLALMTRGSPLIIDQPEDELGYGYIVNKIVPKILDAKRERQVIFISHNANIPVLADAEYLIKIRNDPVSSQSKCSIEESGTFADISMCDKLLELEGGERAFQIRQYRYAVPRRTGLY